MKYINTDYEPINSKAVNTIVTFNKTQLHVIKELEKCAAKYEYCDECCPVWKKCQKLYDNNMTGDDISKLYYTRYYDKITGIMNESKKEAR